MKAQFKKTGINKESKKVFSKTVFYSAAIILALFVTNVIFIGIVYSSPTLKIYMNYNQVFNDNFGKNVNILPHEIDIAIWLGFSMFVVGLTVFFLAPFFLTKSKKIFKYTFPILMFTLLLVVGALISMTSAEVSYDKLTKLISFISSKGVFEEMEAQAKDPNLIPAIKELIDQNIKSQHLAWSAKSLGWIISLLKVVVITVVYTKTFFDHAMLTNEDTNVTEQINIKTKKGYIGKNKIYNLFIKVTVLNQRNICLWVFILVLVVLLPQIIYVGSVLNVSSSLGSMFSWNLYLNDLLAWSNVESVQNVIHIISDDEINNLNVITVQTAMIMGVITMLLVMPIYFIRNWNVEDRVIATQSFALILLSALMVMVNFYSMELLARASVTWNKNSSEINELLSQTEGNELQNSLNHIKDVCGMQHINSSGNFKFHWPVGIELVALLVISLLALLIITIILISVFIQHTNLIRTNTSTYYFEEEEWY